MNRGTPRKRTRATAHRSESNQSVRPRKTNSINVTELHISSHVRRVGNSLALPIPLKEARRAGLSAGDPVDAILRSGVPDAFGLLADLPYKPFERAKEALWRDRV